MIRNRRGAGLIDALISIFLVGSAGIVFSASFPSGFAALQQSCEATKATVVAQRKIEQIRSLDYHRLDYDYLLIGGYIDMYPIESPHHFTGVDAGLMEDLRDPAATLTINTDEENKVKEVIVSVSWESANAIPRNVTLTTLVADHSPWVKE